MKKFNLTEIQTLAMDADFNEGTLLFLEGEIQKGLDIVVALDLYHQVIVGVTKEYPAGCSMEQARDIAHEEM